MLCGFTDALYVITRNLQVVCCTDSDKPIVKGEVGTIVDVIRGATDDRSSQTIIVHWESGTKKTYVCTDESLRVLDNSRLGLFHQRWNLLIFHKSFSARMVRRYFDYV